MSMSVLFGGDAIRYVFPVFMFEQNGQKMAEIADTNNAYTRIRYCGVYSN